MRLFFLFLSLFLFTFSLFADRGLQLKKMKEETRLALVIGNNNYKHLSKLKNPINDARAMRRTLQKRGFTVIYKENATKRDMKKLAKKFTHQLSSNGIGMYFFAGHGVNVGGQNFLVGTDSVLKDEDEVEYEALALNFLTKKMKNSKSRLNIIVLDACRNNPFGRSGGGGLAPVSNASGMLVAYATEAGSVASDGKSGKNGLFTKHLITAMNESGADLAKVFKRTRQKVYKESDGEQSPGIYDQTLGEFYFTLPSSSNYVEKTKKESQKSSSFSFSDDTPTSFGLTVKTSPSNAKVSITNIKVRYYAGIQLSAGKYMLKVSKAGYFTKTGSVNLQSDLSIRINLKKKQNIKQVSLNNSDIYIDSQTSLMWQNEEYSAAEKKAYSEARIYGKNNDWNRANSYCENLTLNNFNDWYLPRKAQLIKLHKQKNALENPNVYYWTSSKSTSDSSKSWAVYFKDSTTKESPHHYKYNVRCVRNQ